MKNIGRIAPAVLSVARASDTVGAEASEAAQEAVAENNPKTNLWYHCFFLFFVQYHQANLKKNLAL